MTNLLRKTILAATAATAATAMAAPLSQAPAQRRAAPVCPVINSNWQATVNAMPGPGSRPTLIVTGNVQVPTAGYRLNLVRGSLVGTTQHFILQAIRPRGAAAEMIANMKVRAEARAPRGLQRVRITCRGKVIGNARVTWAY